MMAEAIVPTHARVRARRGARECAASAISLITPPAASGSPPSRRCAPSLLFCWSSSLRRHKPCQVTRGRPASLAAPVTLISRGSPRTVSVTGAARLAGLPRVTWQGLCRRSEDDQQKSNDGAHRRDGGEPEAAGGVIRLIALAAHSRAPLRARTRACVGTMASAIISRGYSHGRNKTSRWLWPSHQDQEFLPK